MTRDRAVSSYQATFRSDVANIVERLQPRTIGCFELAELSLVPIQELVRAGREAWFVDGEAGRMRALLGGEIARSNGKTACLACDLVGDGSDVCSAYMPNQNEGRRCCELREAMPRDPMSCTQFVPGRRLRVIDGDARRGRGAAFATRVESVVAAASTPLDAVVDAIAVCKRSAQVDVPLPLEDGTLDLLVSVLAPPRLMQQPYAFFEELMTRRFGAWTPTEPGKLANKLVELRLALFRTQLEAHVRELARLTHPLHGRMYFATVSGEAASDGAWEIDREVTATFDTLARYFTFDFETFPAESFLRRSAAARRIVLQAALLRPKHPEKTGGG